MQYTCGGFLALEIPNSKMNNTSFSETQRFRQTWIWIVMLGINAVVVAAGLYAFFMESSSQNKIVALGGIFIPVWLVVFFLIMRLETAIDAMGISYRFFPVHSRTKRILWDDVAEVYVRKYSPIREYGGWGIRNGWGKTGRAFNVRGNMGLQLVFKDGKKLLIGTQRPDEITNLLKQLGKI